MARVARLDPAGALAIPPSTPADRAWAEVMAATGVDAERLAQHVADYHELEVADLEAVPPHAHRLLPSWIVHELGVLPLRATDATLVVATDDPDDTDVLEQLKRVSGRTPIFEVAPPAALARAMDDAYPGEGAGKSSERTEPEERALRVLVVDDDEDTRLLLRTILEGRGFVVDEAVNGAQALDMLEGSGGYDLMTLDLYMEAVHGLDVLRHVRTHLSTASMSVLVTTASDDPAIQMKVLDAGADDYIVKPVDPPRFLLRVQAVLRRRLKGLLDLT